MKPKLNWKSSLFLLPLLALTLPTAAGAQVLGYWNFEEKAPGNAVNNATNAIADLSGNSHFGTVADTGVFYVAGNSNYTGSSALEFTLGPDHVAVPDPAGVFNYSASQSITLEAMIKTTAIGQDGIGAIVCKQGANPGEWWWRINANGTQQFYSDDSTGGRSASGTKRLNDGRWHHVAAVFDATAQTEKVYVDYVQDGNTATAAFTPGNTIGNTQDLFIAAFQAGNRQFLGDIDFVRISAGALSPSNFVQPLTYITAFSPTNGSIFATPGAASFEVVSSVGVSTSSIVVLSNGVNIAASLGFAGNSSDWIVSLPASVSNRQYVYQVTVTDTAGHQAFATNTFNTFDPNSFSIEAEDYNFSGGQYIDNPQLSSQDAPNNYLDRIGQQGIDFSKLTNAATTLYRIGDAVGTIVSGDILRQQYVTAQTTDPGVADYLANQFVNTEWVNYTRTFPSGSYHVYARVAKTGTLPIVVRLDNVTSDPTLTGQTTSPVGTFTGLPTSTAQTFETVPLADAFGREVSVPLSGVKTLRASMVSGTTGLNLNYFVFVPEGGVQVPYLASISPIAGADGELTNTSIHATVRNGDTTINTGSVVLKLDAATVSPSVAATSTGAQIDYTPASVAVGAHTVTLVYTDSATTSITNTWQFRVASQPVRGYWNFNEKAAGNFASTTNGAIIDVSGNARNGTVNDAGMPYMTGSFNYSNTTALRFNANYDHVVIPDVSGSLNYSGAFTWEAIIRTSSTATNLAIIAKNGTGDGEGEYYWRILGAANGVQSAAMNDKNGLKVATGSSRLNDGGWHHVAVVYDTNLMQIRLYADYALDATLTNVFFTNTVGRPADLLIGDFNGGGNEFDGDIDAIKLTSGALTTAQFIQTSVALGPLAKAYKPNTNAVNVFPTPLIELDIQNRDTKVAQNSLQIFVDSVNVTAFSTSSTNSTNASIFYTPTTKLADGVHTVKVTYTDDASPANLFTNTWSFTVLNNLPVLGFYQFNEKVPTNFVDQLTNAIIDWSGSNHSATPSSNTIAYVAGSTNYGSTAALEFTVAAAVHLTVPDSSAAFNFAFNQSRTFEAVIKTTTSGQSGVGNIISKQGAAPGEWYWRITSGIQRLSANDGTGLKSVTGTKLVNDGKWHHIAVIYDATLKQLRAYVDYVQDAGSVATTYSSTIGNAGDVWIGVQNNGGSKYEGDLDFVRVTAAALDTSSFIQPGGLASAVKLLNLSSAGGNIGFNFLTEYGRNYTVQSATTLSSPVWTDVTTIGGDGTTKSASYGIGGGTKFYRVRAQ